MHPDICTGGRRIPSADCGGYRGGDESGNFTAVKERMNREANDFDKENTGQEKGFGLWNVHQRIRLGYGAPCGVELSSEEGKGTRVVLRVLRNMGD